MSSRADFERIHEQAIESRSSPFRPVPSSPFVVSHPRIPTPMHLQRAATPPHYVSPLRLCSPYQNMPPPPVQYSPYHNGVPLYPPPARSPYLQQRKRPRSSTASSQDFSVSSDSEDEERILGNPPKAPRYFQEDEEDINSSDSEFEDDENDDDNDDLRDFIDFDPKFNRARISKRKPCHNMDDELEQFLFAPAKPRKWFKRLTENTVGAKLGGGGSLRI